MSDDPENGWPLLLTIFAICMTPIAAVIAIGIYYGVFA